jgi:hypothetical protein
MSTFSVVVEPLTPAERAELAALEIAIRDDQRVFAAMGERLMRIRDARLYRENYATFEDYCLNRWGFSRRTGYDLMQTAEDAARVQEVAHISPTREQARELAPLRTDAKAMAAALTEAHELYGPGATGTQVREIVRAAMPDAPPRKDMRFENLSDAVDLLQDMPDAAQILWPVDEYGDVQLVEESFDWLEAWLPKAKASWRAHKALLPKEMRPKPKARRKLRAA